MTFGSSINPSDGDPLTFPLFVVFSEMSQQLQDVFSSSSIIKSKFSFVQYLGQIANMINIIPDTSTYAMLCYILNIL